MHISCTAHIQQGKVLSQVTDLFQTVVYTCYVPKFKFQVCLDILEKNCGAMNTEQTEKHEIKHSTRRKKDRDEKRYQSITKNISRVAIIWRINITYM